MIDERVDVAIIGGGPAGLAAGISAKQHGVERVLIIDRNSWLGGILPQCIHDGFGVEETGSPMTGPEYAEKYIKKGKEQEIQFMNETMVVRFEKNLEIVAVNKKGLYTIRAKAIVLATGCREKTRWHALIPGTRPSGIYTAGVAQAFINLYNIMPGKNIVIIGSGDVGLIMARRLTLEGANVLAVAEILPYASGLPRNIVQCLDDYSIPLFLNHTVTSIAGKERVEQVTLQQVDEHWIPIPGTERQIPCDTLLLSLGLVPENELAKSVGIEIDDRTSGPLVNQQLETTLPGVFACGNSLQVYDTVDMLAIDAQQAGRHAAMYAVQKYTDSIKKTEQKSIKVIPFTNVRSVVPQRVNEDGIVRFTLRAQHPCGAAILRVMAGERELLKKKLPWVNPVSLISVDVAIPSEIILSVKNLKVSISAH
jgi:NADPH-dependent 2,4-dienoyl-CoA reductase/sulfur reductase-like enzyme